MPDYLLSKAADADLEGIGRHSAERWGFERAAAYLLSLQRGFESLAKFPASGRSIDDIREGYFRKEIESHVAFYQHTAQTVLIVRVLHAKMDPIRHLNALF